MLRAYLISYPVLLFFWSVLASWGVLTVYDEINFSNDEVAIDLSDSIHPIEVLEYSDGLSIWTPISRNYGNGWKNVFPKTLTINTNVQGDAQIFLTKDNQGFFRYRYETSDHAYTALELVSFFLMQATFGPNLSSISSFPNVFDQDFNNNQNTHFETWIDDQISKPPFLHRSYYRQRSDPDFTDNSSQSGYLENEVGHDVLLGQRFTFYRGNTKYATDNTNPMPGYGGLFDIDGNLIDPNLHSNNLDYNNIPKIGFHYDNAIVHAGNVWDVRGLGTNDTKKVVWFEAAINGEDQLRQRVAWALSQYFVIGEPGSNHPNTTERYLNFYDIFVRGAFGNFRNILSEVTWSPHMGYYLSYIDNRKADPSQGTFPDENFAREVMQLFTIGLWELNEDGTLELDNEGNAIPTYDNDDIAEFAKVFTGLRRPLDRTNIEIFYGNYIDPMRIQSWRHDFSTKTLLDGSTLGPFNQNQQGVRNDVEGLLDHLFNHKNMPPFFAKFLIQRMTISNPSPNYIQSVADAFKAGLYNGTGSGNRGDMVSTIKAVLLHPEARERILSFDTTYGKLREPLIRLMHISRAFNLNSLRTYEWIYFKGLEDTILQAPYESPSVFNFYRPNFTPNGLIGDLNLFAPEFQINNDVSSLHLYNAYHTLINHGLIGGDFGNIGSKDNAADAILDFSYEVTISYNNQILLNHLDLILCGGRLDSSVRQTIIDALIASNLNGIDKVKYATSLVVLSTEFNTLF
jgi:uncharacterized protein (DUF1800 family)